MKFYITVNRCPLQLLSSPAALTAATLFCTASLYKSHALSPDDVERSRSAGHRRWKVRPHHPVLRVVLHGLPVPQRTLFKVAATTFACVRDTCALYNFRVCFPVTD